MCGHASSQQCRAWVHSAHMHTLHTITPLQAANTPDVVDGAKQCEVVADRVEHVLHLARVTHVQRVQPRLFNIRKINYSKGGKRKGNMKTTKRHRARKRKNVRGYAFLTLNMRSSFVISRTSSGSAASSVSAAISAAADNIQRGTKASRDGTQENNNQWHVSSKALVSINTLATRAKLCTKTRKMHQ